MPMGGLGMEMFHILYEIYFSGVFILFVAELSKRSIKKKTPQKTGAVLKYTIWVFTTKKNWVDTCNSLRI